MVTMADEDLPAPVDGDVDTEVANTSSVAVTNPTDNPSHCLITSSEVGGIGSADSDSGGSLSSSASPAPLPGTATHDEWNTNEPSDGADSGVGANGSTPVDGDSLCLSFDGPVTTGSPAYMLTPPFVPAHYQPVPPAMHPSCVTVAPVVGANGQSPVSDRGSAIVSHPPDCEVPHDGCIMTDSTANVMSPGSAAAAAPSQQYVVNVHVNAGETFSVRAGDRVQLIHGPATVRMVSNSGPPVPMPMQVPPGHMVQQIVDENGILTHVILSPQPPGIPAPGMMQSGPPMYGPYGPAAAAGPYVPYPQHFPPAPPPHHHHPGMGPVAGPHHIHHPMMHGPPVAVSGAQPPPGAGVPRHHHQCNSHGHHVHAPAVPGDDRTMQTRSRLRRKLGQRKANDNNSNNSAQHTKISAPQKPTTNGDANVEVTQSKSKTTTTTTTVAAGDDGQEPEDEQKIIHELLSRLESPEVSEVEARSALIQLTPPTVNTAELDVEVSEFQYELSLSDKQDGSYTIMYSGDATEIKLRDLKPAADYFVKICCLLDDVHGDATEAVKFTTLVAEPDQPMPPRLQSKTKTSLQLKWNAVCDNGSKVTSYSLEYDQGSGDGSFVEIYSGSQKQHKLTKLSPSTSYAFRLAAVNSIGQSRFSSTVVYCTSGTVPSQPDPPMLSECCVKALTISWVKRPCDDSFTLHMEDETTGHGFLTVYNGSELSYKISQLRRNTEYKFRLQATNEEGNSKWSDVVCFRTLPDRPQHPSKPQVKGRITSSSFRCTWDEPRDTGGVDIQDYHIQLDAGYGFQGGHRTVEREFTAEHLEPGHAYRLRVCCFSTGGQSDWSEVLSVITVPVPPGSCKPPRLYGRPKATSLAIVWEDPEYDGGSSVIEYLVTMNSNMAGTRDVYRGHDTQCTVASLLPGRLYTFQVKANNKAGWGPYSEALQTLTGAGVPHAPSTPDIYFKSPTVAVIGWQEPVTNGAPIIEYHMEWTCREDQDFVQIYSGCSSTHELSRLTPATTYGFRVRAVNSAGVGPFSNVSWSQTPMSSPAAVSSVRATSTPRSIRVFWKEPASNGSRILSYNIDIGDQRPLMSVDADTLEYNVTDLMPDTAYKIRVQAVNGIGVGAFSIPIRVTTRALPPFPPVLEIINVGSNSVKLKWGDGKNVDLLRYVLEMRRDDYGSYQPIYQGTGQTHKVNKLSESTDYHFRIYATNEAGDGPVSTVQTCRTTKAPPPAPKPPKISDLSIASCVVDWTPLKPLGMDSLIYVLQLQHISNRDLDYHEVYRGPDRTYRITGLTAKSDYQVRVNAVRHTKDDAGSSITLTGPFSATTPFTTPAVMRSINANNGTAANSSSSSFRGWMSEQTWMFILILIAFMFFAIVVAFIAKQIVD